MSTLFLQDIFELKCMLQNIETKQCCRIENGEKKLLAILNNDGDLILHYTFGELKSVIRRIPWYTELNKAVRAICFDPTATWLLVVSLDGCLHIIPALSLVDKNQKVDCKWSLSDVTTFPKASNTPDVKPLSAVWWQTLDSNQNALVGYESGAIALISLTDGRCLGVCAVSEPVAELHLCQDDHLDSIFLLITGTSSLQWRLQLENRATGYLWPTDLLGYKSPRGGATSTDDSHIQLPRSRLHSLKQLGASLKQRIVDSRPQSSSSTTTTTGEVLLTSRRGSQTSDGGSDASSTTTSSLSEGGLVGGGRPTLLPHLCDTVFAPQAARNRYYFSVFYKPSSLFTVHASDIESAPLFIYKLPLKTHTVLLTDRLIYTINEDLNNLNIISTQHSECRLEGESEFNNDSLIAQFPICLTDDEKIVRIYKLTDTTIIKGRKYKDDNKKGNKVYTLPKTVDELNLARSKLDTCVIITNKSVYKLIISIPPIKKFVSLINDHLDFVTADKLAKVFGLNLQQLFEVCGDLLLTNGSYHQGLVLYKQAKTHLLKRVLKLAVTSDCRTLLKFINLCLANSKVEMSMATKLHIGNLAVMAYTELLLRFGGNQRIANTKDFMSFLCHAEHYDQILAVNVACQAGHWPIVSTLATARGLHAECAAALAHILQTGALRTVHPPRLDATTNRTFLLALSSPHLSQTLYTSALVPLTHLTESHCSTICTYVRRHASTFTSEILQRFAVQMDPSQPSVRPLVDKTLLRCRQRGVRGVSSGGDSDNDMLTTLDSYDGQEGGVMAVCGDLRVLIETYILVVVNLIEKTGDNNYNVNLLDKVETPYSTRSESTPTKIVIPLPALRPLSCGYEHTAIVRNSAIYTMGIAHSGCLGLGPLLTQSSPPKVVQTLVDLRVRALSVSCGKKHTLALTDNGVYSWGSNTYGQLGLGHSVLESPHPQLILALCDVTVIDIVAGQYHSVALSIEGSVYSWGWGIHGQLGHSTCSSEYIPRLLELKHSICQIAAGHAHTLLLTIEGQIFGTGSNVFGQLEHITLPGSKTSTPVAIEHDEFGNVERITTAYFHNIAVCKDRVHVWGANPQEVRSTQAKYTQKLSISSEGNTVPYEPWREAVTVFSREDGNSIASVEDIAVGYKHSALLHNGRLMWGRSRDGEFAQPRSGENGETGSNSIGQKFTHVSCGADYIMAMEQNGKVFAWGNNTMAQTLLGKQPDDSQSSQTEGKVAVLKNTRRIVKLPSHNGTSANISSDTSYPIEVAGLPTLAISYTAGDPRIGQMGIRSVFSIRAVENNTPNYNRRQDRPVRSTSEELASDDDALCLNYGVKTLHYILEVYHGVYGGDYIQSVCAQFRQTQACSKVAMLDGRFGDSLSFQLAAFKEHMDRQDLDLRCGEIQERVDNPEVERNNTPGHILSASSSLDSIRQWGDDVEHQGGRESPCEDLLSDIGDNVRQYVQSVRYEQTRDQPPSLTSLQRTEKSDTSDSGADIFNIKTEYGSKVVKSDLITEPSIENSVNSNVQAAIDALDTNEQTREIVKMAAHLVEFYIEKTYASENHILMQNILLKCLAFWLNNGLPVSVLERVLLKNVDKYFYPLSLLLFCKNVNNNIGEDQELKEDTEEKRQNSAGFLKEFSTKFCLRLCSMVLENVSKA